MAFGQRFWSVVEEENHPRTLVAVGPANFVAVEVRQGPHPATAESTSTQSGCWKPLRRQVTGSTIMIMSLTVFPCWLQCLREPGSLMVWLGRIDQTVCPVMENHLGDIGPARLIFHVFRIMGSASLTGSSVNDVCALSMCGSKHLTLRTDRPMVQKSSWQLVVESDIREPGLPPALYSEHFAFFWCLESSVQTSRCQDVILSRFQLSINWNTNKAREPESLRAPGCFPRFMSVFVSVETPQFESPSWISQIMGKEYFEVLLGIYWDWLVQIVSAGRTQDSRWRWSDSDAVLLETCRPSSWKTQCSSGPLYPCRKLVWCGLWSQIDLRLWHWSLSWIGLTWLHVLHYRWLD